MVWMEGDSSSSDTNNSTPTTSSPSQPSSPVARKKKITRTRTGCQTCRDRKVKCGEEKPSCSNCQRTNHVCPGYAPATVFKAVRRGRSESITTEEPDEGSTVTIVTTGQAQIESSLTWTPMLTQNFEDLKLLHYYTSDFAHTLSLPGAIGRTWSEGVPQLAFEGDQHVYLIHALLATAAAHKVSKNPYDIQSKRRGQQHYVRSLTLLQTLDLTTCETHASAALAAVMLLTWYESLYSCWENGVVHIRGAAKIVREHNADLLKTPTGRQLLHLFGRLELSASRHILIDDQYTITATTSDKDYWEKAALDINTLTIDDLSNGNCDFEYAWTEMMKIMVPITILRMVPRIGDKGTPQRKAEGEKILEKLRIWEELLPASFAPVEAPEVMMVLEDSISQHLQPIYYSSLNVAVAMAHHSALQLNVFTLTHRGDEPKPPSFLEAVDKTLRICLGVQRMRQLGLFHVQEGGDYGILWPFAIAAIRVSQGDLRTWIFDLLSNWPREGLIDPFDIRIWLDAMWSRLDQGFGVEALHKMDSTRAEMTEGKPIRIEIVERCLEGEYKGYLRTVEMVMHAGETMVNERTWHRGDVALEHVVNITSRVSMTLPQ